MQRRDTDREIYLYRSGRDEVAMTRYRPERYTDQEEMQTSNDEIQTGEIYRPGRDEVAVTKIQARKIYRSGRDVDQQRRETDQEDTQTRNRCRHSKERNE